MTTILAEEGHFVVDQMAHRCQSKGEGMPSKDLSTLALTKGARFVEESRD